MHQKTRAGRWASCNWQEQGGTVLITWLGRGAGNLQLDTSEELESIVTGDGKELGLWYFLKERSWIMVI